MARKTGVPTIGLEEILAAASRLFAERGFHAASMRDISNELGMHAGSLYVHIASKEDLLSRIVDRIIARHRQDMSEVLASDLDPPERLAELARRLLALLSAEGEATGVYFREWRHLSEERQRAIVAARDEYEAGVRRIIADGKRDGSFRQDVDPKLSGMGFIAMLVWTYEWFSPERELTAEQVADTFTDIFLRGISAA